METLDISEIIRACGGTSQGCYEGMKITGISTDSRKIKEGDLYIPLRGEKFDGHDFIDGAYKSGAALVLTEEDIAGDSRPYIKVNDTLRALHDIAGYYKSKFHIPFVAVTGSSGKTTTKDMLAAVLGEKYRVLKTEGNFNNAIGLPLTIFNLDRCHEVAVLEMGMNSLGEIETLAEIVRPDIGVISNVGTAHIEKLKSRENILKAKMELFTYFTEKNAAIVNGDNEMLKTIKNTSYRLISYGIEEGNELRAYNIEEKGEAGISFDVNLKGRKESFHVPIPGIHNVYNALSAIAVAELLEVDYDRVRNGLLAFKPSKMRMDIFELKDGSRVINDAYNANPESMMAAINVLKSLKGEGRTVSILGNMLELGEMSKEGHHNVGEYAAKAGIDIVIAIGDMAEYIGKGAAAYRKNSENIYTFAEKDEAIDALKNIIRPLDVILVKGSRGAQMEYIVNYLRERG